MSNGLQVCSNPECHAECGAQFGDILKLPLPTHMQSISDQHSKGKQGVELCCSPCEIIPVANSPIHRVYWRYTKFRWTQNIDEMCFFAKESIKILNVFSTNQLRKCYKDYFAYLLYHRRWLGSLSQSCAVNAWDCACTSTSKEIAISMLP